MNLEFDIVSLDEAEENLGLIDCAVPVIGLCFGGCSRGN
jgi:hypothetical protein